MPVSSNSLFHFTNSLENILSILEYDFIPRYHKEEILLGADNLVLACPMVCFCDIPLSQIKNHLDIYGNYGIGLSKEWGISKKLNPVLYLEANSNLSDYIFKLLELIEVELPLSDDYQNHLQIMNEVLMHIKAYKKENLQAASSSPYLYYDEKEWRFVPPGYNVLTEDEFSKEQKLSELNDRVSAQKLVFHPDDIKYIILKNSNELDLVIKKLPHIKKRYEDEQINRVISRIITVEQIKEDF